MNNKFFKNSYKKIQMNNSQMNNKFILYTKVAFEKKLEE